MYMTNQINKKGWSTSIHKHKNSENVWHVTQGRIAAVSLKMLRKQSANQVLYKAIEFERCTKFTRARPKINMKKISHTLRDVCCYCSFKNCNNCKCKHFRVPLLCCSCVRPRGRSFFYTETFVIITRKHFAESRRMSRGELSSQCNCVDIRRHFSQVSRLWTLLWNISKIYLC